MTAPFGRFAIARADAVDLPALAHVLKEGFTGHIPPVDAAVSSVAQTIAAESVDLAASRLLLGEGGPVALALIARRRHESRLAGLAVVPWERRGGLGRALLDSVLADAERRGDARMRLEVFEANTAALALYRATGFTTLRRLVGFTRAGGTGRPPPTPRIAAPPLAARLLAADQTDVPWQLAPRTIAAYAGVDRAFTVDGRAVAVVGTPTDGRLILRAIAVAPAHRREGRARALLDAIAASMPGREWVVPQVVPEEVGAFFLRTGWTQLPLAQLELVSTFE